MNLDVARNNMLSQQIRACDVLDEHLLTVINNTPREYFVPEQYAALAYADTNIPLDHDQVMMTPKDEGAMLQALQIKASDTILEVGTGSAYVTALLAKLGKYVYSVDIIQEFTNKAKQKLDALDIHNVTLETGDASQGWEAHAPFDVIVVTGSLPLLTQKFRQCLAPGGRLFAVLGESPVMEATLVSEKKNCWHEQTLFETELKPLMNAPTKESFKF